MGNGKLITAGKILTLKKWALRESRSFIFSSNQKNMEHK
jgi:hypothetical protein